MKWLFYIQEKYNNYIIYLAVTNYQKSSLKLYLNLYNFMDSKNLKFRENKNE
jgi:hypothetical protein